LTILHLVADEQLSHYWHLHSMGVVSLCCVLVFVLQWATEYRVCFQGDRNRIFKFYFDEFHVQDVKTQSVKLLSCKMTTVITIICYLDLNQLS
jgi:hypothetical protein